MLDAFKSEEIGPIVYITLYYGLRKSEALGLRWQAIDFDANMITINHTVVGGTRIIAKDNTKTYCSKRTYELLPEIKALLLQLREQQKDFKKRLGSGYITTQPTESFGTFLRNICKCSLPNSLGKSKTAPPF